MVSAVQFCPWALINPVTYQGFAPPAMDRGKLLVRKLLGYEAHRGPFKRVLGATTGCWPPHLTLTGTSRRSCADHLQDRAATASELSQAANLSAPPRLAGAPTA